MNQPLVIVWFRQDLRLADNPALALAIEAAGTQGQVLPVFIDDPLDGSVSSLGSASRAWLHHSLLSLHRSLVTRGAALQCFQGAALPVLRQLVSQTGASRLFWNRCYDPATRARDEEIKRSLRALEPVSANASLLFEPWETLKADGTPYRVFTPFWRHLNAHLPEVCANVAAAPPRITGFDGAAVDGAVSIEALQLLPRHPWHVAMMSHHQVGEDAAGETLERFLSASVRHYDKARDIPGEAGTSRLSAHLHFGETGPRQIVRQVLGRRRTIDSLSPGELVFVKEVVWREFGYSLLFHFPTTLEQPMDRRFRQFPWREDDRVADDLAAWQRGQTGIPIVDAGMRELYARGWMHNRVRMIVASFLIKNLLIPWQAGEAWFRDTLVDADLASNAMGWQWAAGSGADAAPFFRIFNPVLQGERFDADGVYVRQWVSELADVEDRYVHKPWELPVERRRQLDYVAPIVDLKASRQRALDALATMRQSQ